MDSGNGFSVHILLNGCSIILHVLTVHILGTMITPENSKKKNLILRILRISRRLNILEVVLGCTRIVYHILQMLVITSEYISEQHQHQCYTFTTILSCCVEIFYFVTFSGVERIFPHEPSATYRLLGVQRTGCLNVDGYCHETLKWSIIVNALVCAFFIYLLAYYIF